MRMNSLMKPIAAVTIAATMATSFASVAEAGRRNNNAGKLLLGLGIGIIAGSIISQQNRRHNSGVYVGSYDNDVYGGCYRADHLVCDTRWVCKRNKWGEKVCREKESCHRPLICD